MQDRSFCGTRDSSRTFSLAAYAGKVPVGCIHRHVGTAAAQPTGHDQEHATLNDVPDPAWPARQTQQQLQQLHRPVPGEELKDEGNPQLLHKGRCRQA